MDMSKSLTQHPYFRPLLAVLCFFGIMQLLKMGFRGRSRSSRQEGQHEGEPERLVVAHFMLGNTFPFTEEDWSKTFDLAEETGLDGFALNLGPEDWQLSQAQTAYRLAAARRSGFKLFLSLDMNVLPSSTREDGETLIQKVLSVISSPAQLLWGERPILSSFSGHSVSFGEQGWEGWLPALNKQLAHPVFFMPSFFLPPEEILKLDYVDGTFAWNNAWPMRNETIDLREDQPFLHSEKPYMAAVSPLFSTHYGVTGQWAFNKNWIYRSDDLLLPTRWQQLLELPPRHSPAIVQVISWNDHGESHAIAPVLGAQPGSEAWTDGTPHDAFREMTRYFAQRWKGLAPEVEDEVVLWMWYRPHGRDMTAASDDVGRPDHAEWAQDLINVLVLVPQSTLQHSLHIRNGPNLHTRHLRAGRANALTLPFTAGQVRFELTAGAAVVLAGQGREIVDNGERYNFNMWTGVWREE